MTPGSTRQARLNIALLTAVPVLAISTAGLFDTPVTDALLGLSYELVVVAIPGWLLYGALVPTERSALRHLAIAWPIGAAIELFAFAVTAACDVRALFVQMIILIAALTVLPTKARQTAARNIRDLIAAAKGVSPVSVALFDLMFAVILIVLAGEYYSTQPLPESVGSVLYYVDVPWHWGLIGELLNHWPPTDPDIAGDPLNYHYFSHMHMAAISQATGLDPSVVLLRVAPIAPLLSSMLLLCQLARALGARLGVGLLATGVIFLACELDFDAMRESPFLGPAVREFAVSPSLAFGIPLFLAALALTLRLWDRTTGSELGGGCALGIVLVAAGGAKSTILPVLGLGLALYLLWTLIARRSLSRRAIVPLGLVLAAFAFTYVFLYAGASGGRSQVELSGAEFVNATVFALSDHVLTRPERLLSAPIAMLFMQLSLAGIAWLVLRPEPLSDGQRLLLALLAAGAIYGLTLSSPGISQLYFLRYGLIAGGLLSAIGLADLYSRLRDRSARGLAAVGIGVASGGFGLALLVTAIRNQPISNGSFLLITAVISSVLLLVAVGSARVRRDLGAFVLAAVLIPGALAASAFDPIGDLAVTRAGSAWAYRIPTPPASKGLTSDLSAGLLWVRENTPKDAVLAVANQEVAPGDPRYFLYSAFSERRTFLGGWDYAERARGNQEPATESIRARQQATARLLAASSCRELRESLRTAPADYALYDRVNTHHPEQLRAIGSPMFQNRGMAVYNLRGLCPPQPIDA